MWGRLWPLLLSFLTATAVPGPSLRRPSRELDATPRMTIPYEGLTAPTSKGSRSQGLEVGRQSVPGLGSQIPLSPELSGTRHFKGQAQNYSTLLLEEASARLLVGARGALFSLNACLLLTYCFYRLTTSFHCFTNWTGKISPFIPFSRFSCFF